MNRELQAQLKSMQDNRDLMMRDFENRWQVSRNELENVIEQLESEKKERKSAWEKEVQLTKQLEVNNTRVAVLRGIKKID